MKTLITLTLSTCMMLALTTSAFAPPQPGQPPKEGSQPDGMALLEESHGLMKELAENDLPVGNVGDEVQNKEKKIIQNLDDLIQLVLDQDAEEIGDDDDDQKQECESCKKGGKKGQSKPGASKPSGKTGGEEPAAMAGSPATGNPKGNEFGELDKESEGSKADEWGLLPEAEFERVRMTKETIVPKGYDELVERFRRAVLKEGAKLLPR